MKGKVRAMAQDPARDTLEQIWFEHVLSGVRDARHRANRLALWMPSLCLLALLGFIVLCTAVIVATRVRDDALLIIGLVVGILFAAVAPIMIGYAIGVSRTVHRWVDSFDPAHARTAPPPTTLANEADIEGRPGRAQRRERPISAAVKM